MTNDKPITAQDGDNLLPGLWYRVYLNNPHKRTSACVDVQALADCLPHGSGIDGNWTIEVKRNGDVTCYGEYHALNENGYYCGWRNFRFSIRRAKRNEYHALIGPSAGQWQITKVKGHMYFTTFVGGGNARDYLYDTCYLAADDALGIRSMEYHIVVSSEDIARTYRAEDGGAV